MSRDNDETIPKTDYSIFPDGADTRPSVSVVARRSCQLSKPEKVCRRYAAGKRGRSDKISEKFSGFERFSIAFEIFGKDGVQSGLPGKADPIPKSILGPREKFTVTIQKSHVLIVDDSQDDREMYSHYLSRSGFKTSMASDGQEAVDKALELLPDLVLMDLGLPEVGGWEAIRRLKANDKTKDIPVIVLTGRSFVSAAAVGSDGCLIKPCPPADLLVEVVRLLEKRAGVSSQQ